MANSHEYQQHQLTGRPGATIGPFQLDAAEPFLLRGGFGGKRPIKLTIALVLMWLPFGLMWGAFLAMMARSELFTVFNLCTFIGSLILLCLLAVALSPFLVSGQYCLTSHHLWWKPWLRKVQGIRLDRMRQCRLHVSPTFQWVTISGPQKLSLRFITNIDKLWGYLFAARAADFSVLHHDGPRLGNVLTCPGDVSATGWSTMITGLIVWRPDYIVLLPHEAGKDLGDKLIEGAVRIATGSGGSGPYVPLEVLVPMGLRAPAEEFDCFVLDLCRALQGAYVEAGDAELSVTDHPNWPGTFLAQLRFDEFTMCAAPTKDQSNALSPLVEIWRKAHQQQAAAPPPVRR